MAEKSQLMALYIRNGVTSLDDMREHYNSFADGGSLDTPPTRHRPNFVDRYWEGNKRDIPVTGGFKTHRLAYAQVGDQYVVFPEVQPTDYGNPNSPLRDYHDDNWTAYERAVENNDTIRFATEKEARDYTENYKRPPYEGAVLLGYYPPRNYTLYDYIHAYGGQVRPMEFSPLLPDIAG